MSKSSTRYIATVAYGMMMTKAMAKHYSDLPNRDVFKQKIVALYKKLDQIVLDNRGSISQKESDFIRKSVDKMNDFGMSNGKSYQTYLSFLIGLIAERITEIPDGKKINPKKADLNEALDILVSMYDYYAVRTRSDKFDQDALKLMNNFNLIF